MKPLKLTPVLLFILLLSNFSFSQTGWFNLNPTPTNRTLFTIHMINSLTGYINGDATTIIKTTDGGLTWSKASMELELFGTEHGTYTYPVYISFVDVMTGYADGKEFYKTTNGGLSWNMFPRHSPYFSTTELHFLNENTGYADLTKTTNGGVNWNTINFPITLGGIPTQYRDSYFTSATDGIAYTTNNAILKTTNSGINWIKVLDSNSSRNFYSVSFINSQTGFISAKHGKIYKTTDSGFNWFVINSNLTSPVVKVKFITENTGYSGNYYDEEFLLRKTTDGGYTWNGITFNPQYIDRINIRDFYFNGSGLGLVVGDNGMVYRTSDDGQHWLCVTSKIGYTNYLSDLSFLNEHTGFIADVRGYLLKTTDGGNNFNKSKVDVNYIQSLNFPSVNTGYAGAATDSGTAIIKTTDGGVTWSTVLEEEFTNQIYKINFINNNTGFTVLNNGRRLMRTSDGGVTWNEINSGAYIYFSTNNNIGYYSKVYNQGVTNTMYSLVYKTNDAGATWTLVDSLQGIGIYSFSIVNSDICYANGNKIYKTINGGLNWIVSSDKYASTIQFIDENTGYITGKNFLGWPTGYKTIDGGLHWHEQNFNETKFYFVNAQTGYSIGDGGLIRKTIDGGGIVSIGNNSQLVDNYSLSQNYPNPFNPETKIQFSIPKNALVKIVVYDLLGREVVELVNEFKQMGSYNVSFNSANLSSGIYFYKLITDDFIETKKMILIK